MQLFSSPAQGPFGFGCDGIGTRLLSMLRERLQLTPTQRLQRHQNNPGAG